MHKRSAQAPMVLPPEVVDAAKAGNLAAVREWLESGGDPNETDNGGSTLLMWVAQGRHITDAKIDVARLVLSHGADVNCLAGDRYNPAHCCAIFPEDSSRGCLIQLFLDAGVNVNAKTDDGETPLGIALDCSMWHREDYSRACLDMVTRLLRAGAALDAIQEGNVSAEDLLHQQKAKMQSQVEPPLEVTSHYHVCKALVSDYRAAGSTWKGYVRALPKELLRLRSLVARGRAREKLRTRSKTPREIALLFAPSFPNELFWGVMAYWNPRS